MTRVNRELEARFDDNRSLWCAGKPPYEALPALAGDLDVDVAIVGGGFTGVSTALHIARRFPERQVALLEAKVLANGASGRNGGLMLNWVHGVPTGDVEEARRIYDVTRSAIDLIESVVQEHGLAVAYRRDGCFEAFTDPGRADEAAALVERLRAVGLPLRFLQGKELDSKLRLHGVHGAIFDPTAGQIDGLALVRGLRPVLLSLGVGIFEHTPVLSIEEGRTVRLRTPHGEVRAKAIVLGTNAYTPALGYFRGGIFPLHSHLVATEPLSAETWREIGWGPDVAGFSDDLDRLAYGSMTAGGALVFGGGSNAAYDYRYGSGTRWTGSAEPAFEAIRRRLVGYLPRAKDVRIAHRWSGPVALTMTRVCTMGVRGEHRNVYFALGYSGHGITLANLAGRVLCDIYSDDEVRWRGLPFYEQKLRYIPPEPFRWVGYHVYTALTGRSPRRGL